jgi:hypothetical protein
LKLTNTHNFFQAVAEIDGYAKANGWNPFKYLTRIFEKAATMRPSGDWGQLLPWNLAP